MPTASKKPSAKKKAALDQERAVFVDVVGTEISAIWRNVTRLGGQCVASLYLWDEPRSMDDLAEELGRSKSNVFSNLRALEQLGIVRRVRVAGSAKDHFELNGDYPDVLVVAFGRHLSQSLRDKSTELTELSGRLRDLAYDDKTRGMTKRVNRIAETYAATAVLIEGLLPKVGEPSDLISVIRRVTPTLVKNAVKALSVFVRR